ncbi:MAG: hypothetical protein R2701_00925 [Acidimicrobiales bacterium]
MPEGQAGRIGATTEPPLVRVADAIAEPRVGEELLRHDRGRDGTAVELLADGQDLRVGAGCEPSVDAVDDLLRVAIVAGAFGQRSR